MRQAVSPICSRIGCRLNAGSGAGAISISGVAIESRTRIAELDGRSVEQVLFTVPSSSGTHRYQLWVGWSPHYPDRFGHVFIGETDGQFAYDALHDDDVSALVLANIADGVAIGDLRFSAEGGTDIDRTARGLVIGAEQSNTSIVYGHTSILKVFRRLEPGLNPDAEVHRALWAAGLEAHRHPAGCDRRSGCR